jgi:hypothetical protein
MNQPEIRSGPQQELTLKGSSMKKLYRAATVAAALAKAAFWIDRLWQELQRHQVFMQAHPT